MEKIPHDLIEVYEQIRQSLDFLEIDYLALEETYGGLPGFVVQIPGEHKRLTSVLISVGQYSVRFESFVCRSPEGNQEQVYRFLLSRNHSLYGLAYTLDNLGDIYLIGRTRLDHLDTKELDHLCGQILQTIEEDFTTLITLGFRSALQQEWTWRKNTGQSMKNLEEFPFLGD